MRPESARALRNAVAGVPVNAQLVLDHFALCEHKQVSDNIMFGSFFSRNFKSKALSIMHFVSRSDTVGYFAYFAYLKSKYTKSV